MDFNARRKDAKENQKTMAQSSLIGDAALIISVESDRQYNRYKRTDEQMI